MRKTVVKGCECGCREDRLRKEKGKGVEYSLNGGDLCNKTNHECIGNRHELPHPATLCLLYEPLSRIRSRTESTAATTVNEPLWQAVENGEVVRAACRCLTTYLFPHERMDSAVRFNGFELPVAMWAVEFQSSTVFCSGVKRVGERGQQRSENQSKTKKKAWLRRTAIPPSRQQHKFIPMTSHTTQVALYSASSFAGQSHCYAFTRFAQCEQNFPTFFRECSFRT